MPPSHRHCHEFPAVWYVPESGSAYVMAAGTVIEPERVSAEPDGVGVYFHPAALGEDARSPWPTWRAHPLLFPFLHGRPGGVLELSVPEPRRDSWIRIIDSIDAKLTVRGSGFRQAVLAYLTVLLVDLARFTDDIVEDARNGEPLSAEVFAVIERYRGRPLSLHDVAAELGFTPGHLTTVVRRRTGRTVQDWIIDRRMADARSLLAAEDIPIAEVARRVGIADPATSAECSAGSMACRHGRGGVRGSGAPGTGTSLKKSELRAVVSAIHRAARELTTDVDLVDGYTVYRSRTD